MTNFIPVLILSLLTLSGCTGVPVKNQEIGGDQPLIPTADNGQQESNPQVSIGFEDMSLTDSKRSQSLTSRMEIERQTQNYVDSGQAEVITRPDGTILYPYGLAQARLTAKRMMYSKIVLQEGEKIVSAAAGDTTRWNILPDYIGNASSYTPVVLIKPFMGGLQTSLSIITDRRDYDIAIQSVDSGDYTPRIGFYYPQDKADSVRVGLPPQETADGEGRQPNIDIENIKYDYRLEGDRNLSWYPAGVFEDGRRVFIRMPEGVEHTQLPVFMAIDRSGRTEMVNYRYRKPYYVVDTVFERGVLILGTDKYREMVKIIKV